MLSDATLRLGQGEVELRAGERIAMGFTYCYTPDQVERLLARNRFQMVERFLDRSGENMLVLACKDRSSAT
jgi:uncharacterized SAM-dependent methyltransferase